MYAALTVVATSAAATTIRLHKFRNRSCRNPGGRTTHSCHQAQSFSAIC